MIEKNGHVQRKDALALNLAPIPPRVLIENPYLSSSAPKSESGNRKRSSPRHLCDFGFVSMAGDSLAMPGRLSWAAWDDCREG